MGEKNLAKDYWSSMFFKKLREENIDGSNEQELEMVTGWNYSPRLSCVHGEDDPFHEEQHPSKGSSTPQDVEQQQQQQQ